MRYLGQVVEYSYRAQIICKGSFSPPRSAMVYTRTMRPVGRVGSGIDDATREHLADILEGIERDSPLIPCQERGRWVEPDLYCRVTYLERTVNGELRAPVFKGLIEDME